MIIDFHTHTFPQSISEKALHKLSMASATAPFTNGTLNDLLDSMAKSGVDYSVTLPVMTNATQVEKVNHRLAEQQETLKNQGIIAFGGMHPDYENPGKELRFLKSHGIKGIKLHPAYQGVDLTDKKMLRILDAAANEDMIVVTHAGIDIGIYDHNYTSTKMVLQVLREIGPFPFVLAHMGGWGCWDEVESDLCGAPVYFDTAFSLGPITTIDNAPHPAIRTENLDKSQFLRIATKHGIRKILFATDSPWENQADYISRLRDFCDSEEMAEQILGENAKALLL